MTREAGRNHQQRVYHTEVLISVRNQHDMCQDCVAPEMMIVTQGEMSKKPILMLGTSHSQLFCTTYKIISDMEKIASPLEALPVLQQAVKIGLQSRHGTCRNGNRQSGAPTEMANGAPQRSLEWRLSIQPVNYCLNHQCCMCCVCLDKFTLAG